MAKIAVTVIAYALVPEDEFDERIGEITDALESGLQQADADYANIVITRGIPAEISDTL